VLTISFFVENINPIQKKTEASLDVKKTVYNSACVCVCVCVCFNISHQKVGKGHNKMIRDKPKEIEANFL